MLASHISSLEYDNYVIIMKEQLLFEPLFQCTLVSIIFIIFINISMKMHELLLERFLNFIGNDEQALANKNKWKQQVWDLLQKSYANIGGLKSWGFETPERMVENITFWKLAVRHGKLYAVIMYRDEGKGRKSVAMGTDGTAEGKKFLVDIIRNEFGRAFSERSKGALGFVLKIMPWDVLEEFLMTPEEAQKILGSDYNLMPIRDMPPEELPHDAAETLVKYPKLIDYGYIRHIGSNRIPFFKVMMGTSGKLI